MAHEVHIQLNLVSVWNVTDNNGREVRVATIEQAPRRESMCSKCPAPCCKGIFQPVLTKGEFLEKKFMMQFIDTPAWLKEKVPRAEKLAVLPMLPNGCPYHDHETNLCTVWPDCPESCLTYDCREDDRPEIRDFAESRAKELGLDVGPVDGAPDPVPRVGRN